MSLVSNITKMTYEVNSYNFMLNDDGSRVVYDIYPNGHLIKTSFVNGEETEDGKSARVDRELVKILFTVICELLQNAEHVNHYMDDKTALLTISLNGGEITLPRGLATEEISLNQILTEFLNENL